MFICPCGSPHSWNKHSFGFRYWNKKWFSCSSIFGIFAARARTFLESTACWTFCFCIKCRMKEVGTGLGRLFSIINLIGPQWRVSSYKNCLSLFKISPSSSDLVEFSTFSIIEIMSVLNSLCRLKMSFRLVIFVPLFRADLKSSKFSFLVLLPIWLPRSL